MMPWHTFAVSAEFSKVYVVMLFALVLEIRANNLWFDLLPLYQILKSFEIQLKKGDSLIDMKTDLAAMYLKAGLKNVSCMHLMTDSQVAEEIYLVLINELKSFSPPPDIVVKVCAKQDEADAEKKKCQDVADKTAHQIDLAYLFVNGFAIGDSIHSKPSSSHFRLIFCSFHV